jgi:3-oxoadipate enol-lactonase
MPEIRTSDGIRIHYETGGRQDGPPLVFSNSLGTNLSMWDGQMQEAEERGFRIIRYDQRGHGMSGAPAGDYSLARLGEDIIDLLDALRIEKTAFCGLSMGGMTGMRLAIDHPERFSRMALCNTSSFMPPRDFWEARIKAVKGGGMEAVADAVVERWLTPQFREREPEETKRVRDMVVTTNPTGYVGCCAAIRDMDLRANLAGIRMPALVLIGTHDPATTPEMGDHLVAHIPGVRRNVLDTAHLSNIEQPDEFSRTVLDYLAGEEP